MNFEPLEEKRLYVRAEAVADLIWEIVAGWDWFARKTVGMQITRAADSIGANIAESGGRFHAADVCNFLYFARGSLRETIFWLRRAYVRNLIPAEVYDSLVQDLEQLAKEINASITHQRNRQKQPKQPKPSN